MVEVAKDISLEHVIEVDGGILVGSCHPPQLKKGRENEIIWDVFVLWEWKAVGLILGKYKQQPRLRKFQTLNSKGTQISNSSLQLESITIEPIKFKLEPYIYPIKLYSDPLILDSIATLILIIKSTNMSSV